MGQQQLLLIVLGVIIVGIAIAVGISMFKTNARNSNRDAVINDMNNIAALAQQYYRKPSSMGGGQQSFAGFWADSSTVNNANGFYVFASGSTLPTTFQSGSVTPMTAQRDSVPSGTNATFLIVGNGTELGYDGTHNVQAVALVNSSGPTVQVTN
jgi:Tfp pilus assembly protein PilE